MSIDLGRTDAPPAARAGSSGWRDPRLWIGVALVAASVLLGARLLGGADDTIDVWVAATDLEAGESLSADDLESRRVRFGAAADAGHYLVVGDPLPEARLLDRPVGAGELVPADALGDRPADLLEVPLWAPAEVVPDGLRAGAVVDVWATPRSGTGEGAAVLVLDDAVVLAVPQADAAFGPTGNRQVLVGVTQAAARDVGQALAAARDNRIAFTRER